MNRCYCDLSRFSAWVFVVVLALAACSGSSGEDATGSSADTGGETTSTVESTTTTAAATTTESTEAETTTTTEDPAESVSLEDHVAAEALDIYVVWRNCTLDLVNCDPEKDLSKVATGEQLTRLAGLAESFKEQGFEVYLPESAVHDSVTVISVADVAESATEAEVVLCRIDEAVVIDPGAAPDGSDVIVNDVISTTLFSVTLVLEGDDEWLVNGAEIFDEQIGQTDCDQYTE